ncbi:hypothetical protein J7L48_10675 [bacterium]|nr:hypothetical protein [bacterium]
MSFAKGFFVTIFFLFLFYLFKVFGIIIFQSNGISYINYYCSVGKSYSKALDIFDKHGISHINHIYVKEKNKVVKNIQFIAFKNHFSFIENYLFYDKNALYTMNYSDGMIKNIIINKGTFLKEPKYFKEKLNLAHFVNKVNKKMKESDIDLLIDFNTGFVFFGNSNQIYYIGDFI